MAGSYSENGGKAKGGKLSHFLDSIVGINNKSSSFSFLRPNAWSYSRTEDILSLGTSRPTLKIEKIHLNSSCTMVIAAVR